jgi:hypothetical protein
MEAANRHSMWIDAAKAAVRSGTPRCKRRTLNATVNVNPEQLSDAELAAIPASGSKDAAEPEEGETEL